MCKMIIHVRSPCVKGSATTKPFIIAPHIFPYIPAIPNELKKPAAPFCIRSSIIFTINKKEMTLC